MARVLVAFDMEKEAISLMEESGLSVDVRSRLTQEVFNEIYSDYEGVIVRGNIKVAPIRGKGMLRVVVRAGVGLDNVDVEGLSRMGVKVYNTPDASTNAVAELTIGLMIALSRKLLYASYSLKFGKWVKSELMGCELRGKTIGIIGCGRIGRAVAKLASAFGMKILVHDVIEVPEDFLRSVGGKQVSLEELLSSSDFVTIHVPLDHSTKGLIGEKELRSMKRSAYLLNLSRGGVVAESALKKALMEGWIAGAALDVFEMEPPVDLELLSLPNLIPTPHIGAQTYEAQRMASLKAAEIVVAELSRI